MSFDFEFEILFWNLPEETEKNHGNPTQYSERAIRHPLSASCKEFQPTLSRIPKEILCGRGLFYCFNLMQSK
jgi:hypothetical protein